MILLLCLTFIGQSMATTAMSYHMMSMSGKGEHTQSQAMMEHCNQSMAMDSSVEAEASSENCCVKSCHCFTGGCATVIALIKYTGHYAFFSSPRIPSYADSITSQQPTSLYRPPILS